MPPKLLVQDRKQCCHFKLVNIFQSFKNNKDHLYSIRHKKKVLKMLLPIGNNHSGLLGL